MDAAEDKWDFVATCESRDGERPRWHPLEGHALTDTVLHAGLSMRGSQLRAGAPVQLR
jgi:hypothetical protein